MADSSVTVTVALRPDHRVRTTDPMRFLFEMTAELARPDGHYPLAMLHGRLAARLGAFAGRLAQSRQWLASDGQAPVGATVTDEAGE